MMIDKEGLIMTQYNDYTKNPLKFLWHTKKKLLPSYLWWIWIFIGVLLTIGSYYNIFDIASINSQDYISLSIGGLSFALIITSAALGVYNYDELVILLEEKDTVRIPGLDFLELIAPYVLTITIFLTIGIISLINQPLTWSPPRIISIAFNIVFLELILLGLLSLYNIAYSILMDLYYSIIRKSTLNREKNKKNIE